ncbi:MAG: sodium/alanine symporter [Rickettsiales bacterium]|nr:sodium/alanine symporter [Rickettsiales bacterium]|tara:strand:+ start:472 stop:1830 length:1359 start_codon:yes stop_codon:yes gene_type:complete
MESSILNLSNQIVNFVWGNVLWLVLGAGIIFTIYCRFVPFRYLWHGIQILRGKYDNENDPGQLSHFKALSTALASTIGMGNLAGVAVAITAGGPGALFWMWVTAILGMSTKFFTCTLAVLFRQKDKDGVVHGGPMYVITEALPKNMHFLATWFALAGCIGCLPLFQVNQLVSLLQTQLSAISYTQTAYFNVVIGLLLVLLTWIVIKDGLKSIANVTSKLVPMMVVVYFGIGMIILIQNISVIPSIFSLIISSAFNPSATISGGLAVVLIQGIKRGAFSNEAGIGTEALAHGAAKTKEPIREGLVAMIGPLLDTLIICTLTGLIILIAVPELSQSGITGIALTSSAIATLLGELFGWIFFVVVLAFSFSTLVGYSFYSFKCVRFLAGEKSRSWFLPLYLAMIFLAAITSLDLVLNIVDSAFGLMAIPTLISTLWLSPKVMNEANRYFKKIKLN